MNPLNVFLCLCAAAGRPRRSQLPDTVWKHWADAEGEWASGSFIPLLKSAFSHSVHDFFFFFVLNTNNTNMWLDICWSFRDYFLSKKRFKKCGSGCFISETNSGSQSVGSWCHASSQVSLYCCFRWSFPLWTSSFTLKRYSQPSITWTTPCHHSSAETKTKMSKSRWRRLERAGQVRLNHLVTGVSWMIFMWQDMILVLCSI